MKWRVGGIDGGPHCLIRTPGFNLYCINQEKGSTAVFLLLLNPMVKSKGIPEAIIRLTVWGSKAEYVLPLKFP